MVLFLQMLNSAKKRETDAIEYLYHQFHARIFAYTASRTTDRGTAEDLTSEVFLKMIENIDKVKAGDELSFAAWLFQVARATIANYYDACKKMSYPLLGQADDAEYLCVLEDDPLVRQIEIGRAYRELTAKQRVVVSGSQMKGCDDQRLAIVLKTTPSAIRSIRSRAFGRLRHILNERKDSRAII
jgi:RNA polymerase sigma-70 factor (ECF subfamily)